MTILKNFLFLRIVTVIDQHVWFLVLVWGVLVSMGVWSLFSQKMGTLAKVAWLVSIVFLPIIGLFFYSLRCLFAVEWELLRQMGFFSKSRDRVLRSTQPKPQ